MGIFDVFKRKTAPAAIKHELTDKEAEIAPGIAQVAGTVMKLQLSTASRYAMTVDRDLKDFTWEIQAFAFGVLYAALEQKGVSWYKSPHVIFQFCEAYMPDYDDKKGLASTVLHFGNQPEYSRFTDAGKSAMLRFAHNPHVEPAASDIDDLAIALGFGRDSSNEI